MSWPGLFITDFEEKAFAPHHTCVGNDVHLRCIVAFYFDDGESVVLNSRWKRNGYIVDGSTPRHELIRNNFSPPRVVGIIVKDVTLNDNRAIYTCSVDRAPNDFNSSSVTLRVYGKCLLFMYMCINNVPDHCHC